MQKQHDSDKGKEGMLKEALKEVKRIEKAQGKKAEPKKKGVVEKETRKKPEKSKKLIAVIKIRGQKGIKSGIKDTLEMLCLYRKNFCVVVESTPSIVGMIKKVKDYVTWGEVDEATLKQLIQKRGEKNPKDPKKTKKFFRLHPPRGGFERRGIKVSFTSRGALGYRAGKINELIMKML